MFGARDSLSFEVHKTQPRFCHITITVPATLVDAVYAQASHSQQTKTNAHGFGRGTVPLDYVANNYHSNLIEHVKQFLFNYFVVSFLFKKLRENKLLFLGDPRLKSAHVEQNKDATFEFECTMANQLSLTSWKHFPFKAPQRKKYRDIDRQVESFIQEEQEQEEKYQGAVRIHTGDLVCFDIWIVDENHKALLGDQRETLWIKIGNEEADTPFHVLFLDKETGETFYSDHPILQEYFSGKLADYGTFGIEIKDIIPDQFFSFDAFKQHFRIKTNKDMRKKLIEVFSFRNDVCQRRLMAEGALALMLKHHPPTVASHAILRQQQVILDQVSQNPDYAVYKMESDFKHKIEQLAHKQLKEIILIDTLAYHENISINHTDVCHYLNLTKRPRMKEFIYFIAPNTKINGQETPIPEAMLMQCCMREKTLNHIIYHLTRE